MFVFLVSPLFSVPVLTAKSGHTKQIQHVYQKQNPKAASGAEKGINDVASHLEQSRYFVRGPGNLYECSL